MGNLIDLSGKPIPVLKPYIIVQKYGDPSHPVPCGTADQCTLFNDVLIRLAGSGFALVTIIDAFTFKDAVEKLRTTLPEELFHFASGVRYIGDISESCLAGTLIQHHRLSQRNTSTLPTVDEVNPLKAQFVVERRDKQLIVREL